MSTPPDLTGTVDERTRQLASTPVEEQTTEWLRRQLDAALVSWAQDRTALDIDEEARTDF
ncbi:MULTISPECIES: hypothetical protein [Microbacterium]|nr:MULTISPECIES: hypothetical protein [Microbacterium]AZH80290.1 hypothetical protein CSX12_00280 [Microbacterium sp. Y-01]